MLSKLKILLFILFLQLIVFSQFAGGSGTEEDPWLIRIPENLDSIRYFLGSEHADKYFKQISSIDLGVAPWNEGKGWIPIGSDSLEFMGHYEVEIYYDWNGYDYYYEIWNMSINDSLLDNAGLFGIIRNATIKNVQLVYGIILGKSSCGSLIGSSMSSTIYNCTAASCEVIGYENNIGGLIGTSIADSIAVSCSDLYYYEPAKVNGLDYVGGLIGSCSSTISNCYSNSPVGGNNSIGGFVGSVNNANILNCYSEGQVTGIDLLGGFIGSGDSTLVIHSYWDIESSGLNESIYGEGRPSIEMHNWIISDSTYVDWDFINIWNRSYDNHGSSIPRFYRNIYVGIEEKPTLPKSILLEQNYPNPFNPTTKLTYTLPNGFYDNVKLQIFNTKGELVKKLVNKKQSAGIHTVNFNASNFNSGMYFYTLEANGISITKKMVLTK